MEKRIFTTLLFFFALLTNGCDDKLQRTIDPPPAKKEEPTEEAEYNGPFVDYPDSAAVMELKDLPVETVAGLVQGKWSVYLHGGGVVGPEKLAPGEMDFEFTGTDSVTIHNYHTGITSGRKIIKWKRTSFGHLLFAYKENAVENYYWLQYLHSQDTLHLIFTTSPLLGKGGEIFSSSMMRIKL